MKAWEPNKEVTDKLNLVMDDEGIKKDEIFFLGIIFSMMGLVVEGMAHISKQLENIRRK